MKTSFLLAVASLLTSACGSEADGTGSGAGGGSTSTSSSSSGSGGEGSGGEEPSCPPGPGFSGGESSLSIDTIQALVVDEAGQPVPNLAVQVCGLDVCLYGETGVNGTVVVPGNGVSILDPVFKYGDAVSYPRFGVPITQGTFDFGQVRTRKLPSVGAPLTPGAEATSGDVTLSLPANAWVEIDPLVYDTPESRGFRAVTIAAIADVPAVDPVLNLELLYGVSPLETLICPSATVTVPNAQAWAAGAEVEFWVHGVDIAQGHAPYGGWAKASDGAVSADGATISTSPGQGLPVLTAFGIRLK